MKLFDFEKFKNDIERICPRHQYSDEELARFVCETEERILKETSGADLKLKNSLYSQTPIKVPEALSADGEFYKLYLLYVQSEMFLYNGEYEKYTNTKTVFDDIFERFKREYVKNNKSEKRSFKVW